MPTSGRNKPRGKSKPKAPTRQPSAAGLSNFQPTPPPRAKDRRDWNPPARVHGEAQDLGQRSPPSYVDQRHTPVKTPPALPAPGKAGRSAYERWKDSGKPWTGDDLTSVWQHGTSLDRERTWRGGPSVNVFGGGLGQPRTALTIAEQLAQNQHRVVSPGSSDERSLLSFARGLDRRSGIDAPFTAPSRQAKDASRVVGSKPFFTIQRLLQLKNADVEWTPRMKDLYRESFGKVLRAEANYQAPDSMGRPIQGRRLPNEREMVDGHSTQLGHEAWLALAESDDTQIRGALENPTAENLRRAGLRDPKGDAAERERLYQAMLNANTRAEARKQPITLKPHAVDPKQAVQGDMPWNDILRYGSVEAAIGIRGLNRIQQGVRAGQLDPNNPAVFGLVQKNINTFAKATNYDYNKGAEALYDYEDLMPWAGRGEGGWETEAIERAKQRGLKLPPGVKGGIMLAWAHDAPVNNIVQDAFYNAVPGATRMMAEAPRGMLELGKAAAQGDFDTLKQVALESARPVTDPLNYWEDTTRFNLAEALATATMVGRGAGTVVRGGIRAATIRSPENLTGQQVRGKLHRGINVRIGPALQRDPETGEVHQLAGDALIGYNLGRVSPRLTRGIAQRTADRLAVVTPESTIPGKLPFVSGRALGGKAKPLNRLAKSGLFTMRNPDARGGYHGILDKRLMTQFHLLENAHGGNLEDIVAHHTRELQRAGITPERSITIANLVRPGFMTVQEADLMIKGHLGFANRELRKANLAREERAVAKERLAEIEDQLEQWTKQSLLKSNEKLRDTTHIAGGDLQMLEGRVIRSQDDYDKINAEKQALMNLVETSDSTMDYAYKVIGYDRRSGKMGAGGDGPPDTVGTLGRRLRFLRNERNRLELKPLTPKELKALISIRRRFNENEVENLSLITNPETAMRRRHRAVTLASAFREVDGEETIDPRFEHPGWDDDLNPRGPIRPDEGPDGEGPDGEGPDPREPDPNGYYDVDEDDHNALVEAYSDLARAEDAGDDQAIQEAHRRLDELEPVQRRLEDPAVTLRSRDRVEVWEPDGNLPIMVTRNERDAEAIVNADPEAKLEIRRPHDEEATGPTMSERSTADLRAMQVLLAEPDRPNLLGSDLHRALSHYVDDELMRRADLSKEQLAKGAEEIKRVHTEPDEQGNLPEVAGFQSLHDQYAAAHAQHLAEFPEHTKATGPLAPDLLRANVEWRREEHLQGRSDEWLAQNVPHDSNLIVYSNEGSPVELPEPMGPFGWTPPQIERVISDIFGRQPGDEPGALRTPVQGELELHRTDSDGRTYVYEPENGKWELSGESIDEEITTPDGYDASTESYLVAVRKPDGSIHEVFNSLPEAESEAMYQNIKGQLSGRELAGIDEPEAGGFYVDTQVDGPLDTRILEEQAADLTRQLQSGNIDRLGYRAIDQELHAVKTTIALRRRASSALDVAKSPEMAQPWASRFIGVRIVETKDGRIEIQPEGMVFETEEAAFAYNQRVRELAPEGHPGHEIVTIEVPDWPSPPADDLVALQEGARWLDHYRPDEPNKLRSQLQALGHEPRAPGIAENAAFPVTSFEVLEQMLLREPGNPRGIVLPDGRAAAPARKDIVIAEGWQDVRGAARSIGADPDMLAKIEEATAKANQRARIEKEEDFAESDFDQQTPEAEEREAMQNAGESELEAEARIEREKDAADREQADPDDPETRMAIAAEQLARQHRERREADGTYAGYSPEEVDKLEREHADALYQQMKSGDFGGEGTPEAPEGGQVIDLEGKRIDKQAREAEARGEIPDVSRGRGPEPVPGGMKPDPTPEEIAAWEAYDAEHNPPGMMDPAAAYEDGGGFDEPPEEPPAPPGGGEPPTTPPPGGPGEPPELPPPLSSPSLDRPYNEDAWNRHHRASQMAVYFDHELSRKNNELDERRQADPKWRLQNDRIGQDLVQEIRKLQAEADRWADKAIDIYRTEIRGGPAMKPGVSDDFDPDYFPFVSHLSDTRGPQMHKVLDPKARAASHRTHHATGELYMTGQVSNHPDLALLGHVSLASQATYKAMMQRAEGVGHVLYNNQIVGFDPTEYTLIRIRQDDPFVRMENFNQGEVRGTEGEGYGMVFEEVDPNSLEPWTTPFRHGEQEMGLQQHYRDPTNMKRTPGDGVYMVTTKRHAKIIEQVMNAQAQADFHAAFEAMRKSMVAWRWAQLFLKPGFLFANAIGVPQLAMVGGMGAFDAGHAIWNRYRKGIKGPASLTGRGVIARTVPQLASGKGGTVDVGRAGATLGGWRGGAKALFWKRVSEKPMSEGGGIKVDDRGADVAMWLPRYVGNMIKDSTVAIEDLSRDALFMSKIHSRKYRKWMEDAYSPQELARFDRRGGVKGFFERVLKIDALSLKITEDARRGVDLAEDRYLEIAQEVLQIMGDFTQRGGALSHFGDSAVPFWRWFKHITAFVATMPIRHAKTYLFLNALGEVGYQASLEDVPLPAWLVGALRIPGTDFLLRTQNFNSFATPWSLAGIDPLRGNPNSPYGAMQANAMARMLSPMFDLIEMSWSGHFIDGTPMLDEYGDQIHPGLNEPWLHAMESYVMRLFIPGLSLGTSMRNRPESFVPGWMPGFLGNDVYNKQTPAEAAMLQPNDPWWARLVSWWGPGITRNDPRIAARAMMGHNIVGKYQTAVKKPMLSHARFGSPIEFNWNQLNP